MTQNLPRIIAICGRKRTGKDTIAQHLCEKYGYKNAKFADPLKQAVKGLFGFTDRQIEVDKEELDPFWGITPRNAMQFIGSHVVQFEFQKLLPGISRDFFVKSLLAKYENQHIVISDMRFKHEYDAIQRIEGSLIIKVTRDVEDLDTHISEIEVDEIHPECCVHNNGTIKMLIERIDHILGKN